MATALYAMAINFDVTTDGGLAHLDNYLLTRSFISGHQPSRDDLTVFAALAGLPRPNLVNLTRWYMHIKRLVDAAFPGAPVGVVFDQIETVGFQDDPIIQEPPTPRGGAHTEVASRSVSEENARKVLEESARIASEEARKRASEESPRRASADDARRASENARKASAENSRRASAESARKASEETPMRAAAETGRILENGHHQNGNVPVHPATDETHQEAEAMARLEETRGQTSAGRVSVTGGKSSVLLDVKPWDDETDMEALEAAVRAVQLPGLHWGASKLEPVAFKISKLQIMMTIEDDLISPDTIIEEHLTAPPANEHIQSCDVVVWNKI